MNIRVDNNALNGACRKWLVAIGFVSIVFGSVCGASGNAFSMEFHHIDDGSGAVHSAVLAPKSGTNPDVISKNCLSLLKTASYAHQQEASMYSGNHAAARASALGVIFGVRFALGPKERVGRKSSGRSRGKIGVWSLDESNISGSRKVLAVAEYRRCKSEEALKSLSDWRWQR